MGRVSLLCNPAAGLVFCLLLSHAAGYSVKKVIQKDGVDMNIDVDVDVDATTVGGLPGTGRDDVTTEADDQFLSLEPDMEQLFRGSFKVISGDSYNENLKPDSSFFKEKALKYKNIIDSIFSKSLLKKEFLGSEIVALEGVENAHLRVFFNINVDVSTLRIDAGDIFLVLADAIRSANGVLGGNVKINQDTLETSIVNQVVLSDVTEEQSVADQETVVVTTEYFNEADNEIDRVKRDVSAVVEGVTNEGVVTDGSVDDEAVQLEATTEVTIDGSVDDGIYPAFTRPITPDPNADPSDFTTVNPLPIDYDRDQLDVNITADAIYGRAACQCGKSGYRIVGGEPARINQLPWTAALLRGSGGRPYCGGTLINSLYVVTASHCVDGMSASGISVLLNEQDFNSASESRPQKFSVRQITMHPNYNRRTIDHDIALLRLSQPVSFTNNGPIVPVCLPASNANSFAKEHATVAGWGTTSSGGSTSSVLRKVTVPVLSNQECNTKTKYTNKITENMLCAGLLETGGKDSCQGDSGGPLIIENGGRKTLIGVVSWGYGCAAAYSPGVYTRVGRFPDWILANTKGADWCEG